MPPENAEWCYASSFVPIQAWERVQDDSAAVMGLLIAFTVSLGRELVEHFVLRGETGWNIDALAHHGPVHDVPKYERGVVVVLRAWRLPPDLTLRGRTTTEEPHE